MSEENNESSVEETKVEGTTEEKSEEVKATAEVTENAEVDPHADPDLADGSAEGFKWFIAKTLTGQENKISKSLRERVINHKKTEYFSKILVPEETVVTNANGKKRTIKKKFFPGYVLIRMIMNNDTWHLVKDTDKITGFVGGTPTSPQSITDDEAAYMLGQADGPAKKSRSSVNFEEGETVKVIEGPFASFVGTIEAVSDKGKVKVNVSIFGRPTPVELDFSQVEKVS
jgi:transcriptional antiterminator NusG